MATLFSGDSSEDEDARLTFGRSAYATKYDKLRRQEELLKLKNKYGETYEKPSDSSSSDDEDEEIYFTEKFEKNFYKTLSCLKSKDPKIYNKDVTFFDGDEPETVIRQSNKKEKAVTIRDYNRALILNKAGKLDGEGESSKRPQSPTYVEDQEQIKNSLSKAVNENDDEEDRDDKLGGLFMKKNKTKDEEVEEENKYREWLSGRSENIDLEEKNELECLKDYWTNPKLDEGEAFLRDYVLNQRYKEKVDKRIPTYDEIVNQSDADLSEDERHVGQQAEFEHKFNFRFEEPDQEFIKQYPRTLDHSIRRKDDKRSKKRTEVKERKTEEKQRKLDEIHQLKALKLKEIQEKIHQLKEITGNDQLAFDTEDIEGEFDPDAHDRRMNEIFNEGYYGDIVDDEKPDFPELDEEMGVENWDTWEGKEENKSEPHCEDESFNMDCDFNPNNATKKLTTLDLKNSIEGKGKRKRKNKNKLTQALTQEKPVFDPNKTNKTLSQYLDDYYKLDCEDVIGDMPCRYKYREVPACNYGLTMEEILLADDQELDKWYPLKKTLRYRPAHLDLNDQKIFEKKAANIQLKMKILPSLFKTDEEEAPEENGEEVTTPKKNKKKKKKSLDKIKKVEESEENKIVDIEENKIVDIEENKIVDIKENKIVNIKENKIVEIKENKKGKKRKLSLDNNIIPTTQTAPDSAPKNDIATTKKHKRDSETKESETALPDENISDKKSKRKKSEIKVDTEETVASINITTTEDVKVVNISRRRRKRDAKAKILNAGVSKINPGRIEKKPVIKTPFKDNNKKMKTGVNKAKVINTLDNLTDERLQAYGLNPKKYRSFRQFKKY